MSEPKSGYSVAVDMPSPSGNNSTPGPSGLEFQAFVQQSSDSASTAPPSYRDPAQLESQPSTGGSGSFFSIEYYQQYFNVDTEQVLSRAKASVYPMTSFVDMIALIPDLYGPFWIPTTVIFVSFMTSSVAGWVASDLSGKQFNYDLGLLSFAVSTIYFYVGGMSLAVWAAARYFGVATSWVELFSIYGYSMTAWIPASILCVLPSNTLRWFLVLAAFAISGVFIFRNARQVLARSPHQHTQALLLLVLGAHAILALLFKVQFFSYAIDWPTTSPTTPGTPATPQPTGAAS